MSMLAVVPRPAGLLLLALATQAWGITPLGGQYRVSDDNGVISGGAEAAQFDDGSSVVVWEHHFNTTDYDLYARRYGRDGVAIGPNILIDADGENDVRPQIAARPDGGFTIAYLAPSNVIKVRRYSSAGTLQTSSAYTAVSGTETALLDMDIAVNSNGVERLFWFVQDPAAGSQQYRLKTITNAGTVGNPAFVPSPTSFLRVRADDSGNFIVAWLEGATDSRAVRRFYLDSSGMASAGPFLVTGPTIDIDSDGAPGQFGFDLAAWGFCEAAVVFKDASASLPVKGTFIQYTGSGGSNDAPIYLGNDDGTSLALDCAYNGRCAAAWIDRADATRGSLQLREATRAGLVGAVPLTVGSARVTERLSVDADHDGDMTIAWTGGSFGSDLDRAVARRYSGSEPVDLSLAQAEAADPVVAGNQIGYRISVRNLHPKPASTLPPGVGWATNLMVVDTLPAGASFAGASGSNWTCSHSNGTVQCGYALPLQPQQTAATLSINATSPATAGPETVFNSAYALADQEDPSAANNEEQEQTSLACGPSTFALNFSDLMLNEEAAVVSVYAVRTGGCGAASVQVVSIDESASTYDNDYEAVASTLEWAAGEYGPKSAPLQINEDALHESDEKLRLRLVNPVNGTLGNPAESLVTIANEDPSPRLRWLTAQQTAGEHADAAMATLRLSMVSGRDVSVNLNTSGTASLASDYQLDSTTVVIPAGWTEIQVPIAIDEDSIDESNETAILTLAAPVNAVLADHRTVHTLTIVDNDEPAPVTVAFTAIAGSLSESQASRNIGVALSAASGQTVTVNYAVTGGTATGGGVDYTLADGTLTFNPGQTSKNLVMTIVNDAIDEGSFETVVVTLSAPTNATLGEIVNHSIKILDDD